MPAGCFTGCAGSEEDEELPDLTDAVVISADLSKIVDPPLLKKVEMYNAGCIQPLKNYDRDFERIRELNADALRIDLSIGKNEGTGGRFIVSPNVELLGENKADGTREIDPNSLEYDFAQLDSVMKYMSDNKVLPYMSWCYIPVPLQESGKWNNLDTSVSNWQDVWEEIYYNYAKHYADEGVKIGYHEIYNEPDLEILKCWGVFGPTFDGFLSWQDFCLGNECNPAKGVYPDMYEYGAKGILRADPDATIGGPAFALGEIGVEDWVGFMPRVKNKNLPLDFYSFHSYLDGDTWFKSDEQRDAGEKNELERVVAGLSSDPYFIKTAVHINEYSYLNDATGSQGGRESAFNYYGAAPKTLDTLMEVVDRTSVQQIYWAQFMESTFGFDPYGMIENVKGEIKAPFNAIKMYADMPIWRYEGDLSDPGSGIRTIVSADEEKISILIWNGNPGKDEAGNIIKDGDRVVDVMLDSAPFKKGTRRVYRIDSEHGSSFDNPETAELSAEDVKKTETDGRVWAGTVPGDGVVYITINKDGKKEDFNAWNERTDFADDVKASFYYEDRYRLLPGSREEYSDYTDAISGSYADFDRSTWTMYLGMGSGPDHDEKFAGQACASGAVLFKDIPDKFRIDVKTDGELQKLDDNSTLAVRLDFRDASSEYVKSVVLHNGIYSKDRDPNAQDERLKNLPPYPWGTEEKPDEVYEFDKDTWDIDISKYAPEGWNSTDGRVLISFEMRNTGANTRAAITLSK